MTTGYENNNNLNRQNGESGSQGAPQSGATGQGSQGGWTPYQDDQSRQEFFHRYSDVFQQPDGGYQGSYGTPGGSGGTPPYQPQQPAHRERKRRSGKGRTAGLIAACLVVSLVGGAAGSWGMNQFTGGGSTVFYQSVGGNDNSESVISAAYTGGELTVAEIAAVASPSVVEISTETVSTHSFFSQFIQEGAGSGQPDHRPHQGRHRI